MSIKQKIVKHWYRKKVSFWLKLLLPLCYLYHAIIQVRRKLYKAGLLKQQKLNVPVIVVGNITVGGSGKTPMVVALVELLRQAGLKPGIITRGYKGAKQTAPVLLNETHDWKAVGDESMMLFQRLKCPVVVSSNRVNAGHYIQTHGNVDVIICDDGLQHYRLHRDIEILMYDAVKEFGNQHLLPVGPLREPLTRIDEVDFVVAKGEGVVKQRHFSMDIEPGMLVSTADQKEVKSHTAFASTRCHAVAGIAHPDSFFRVLRKLGITFDPHGFDDHYEFSEIDLKFEPKQPVIMTEKDAVKCKKMQLDNCCYLKVDAVLPETLKKLIVAKLSRNNYGQETNRDFSMPSV